MGTEKIAERALREGLSSVVGLTGEAPAQYNNDCVSIVGNIDAPQRFLKGRFETFEKLKTQIIENDDVVETKTLGDTETQDISDVLKSLST